MVLALWLTKIGVKVRIIDKAEKAGTTSRALVIHARNLEFYHQMGIDQVPLKEGVQINALSFWVGGKKAGHVPFGNIKANISPYQYMLDYPQDRQEEMLEKELANLGMRVERKTELISFEQMPGGGIRAQILKPNGEKEECEAIYLAGCDGARSVVREQMSVGFPGGTYEETFYVADVITKGSLTPGEINIALDRADFLATFPINSSGEIRLVGAIRLEAMGRKDLKWEDVSGGILDSLKLEVEEVKWFSTYRVHHRVASHFREGSVFLLGDAGHIHSPVGGQGMNTGIGDAVNLAWKLGAVIKDNANPKILDTYEPERIAFAKKLVATTDGAFAFVSARGAFSTWVRIHIVPHLLPWLFRFTRIRRFLFRTVSQTLIKYSQSALSEGSAGKLKGGDRLPWVKAETGPDNFASLTTMKWQVHIYGETSASLQTLCNERGIKLNIFQWNAAVKTAGFQKNAIYIIRPDGYIGLAAPNADLQKINAYFDKCGITGI